MNNFLYKINNIKTHNQIMRLKKDNEQKTEKMNELITECKNIVLDYQEKNQSKLIKMNETINKLETEKEEIRKQRDYYKNSLDKIPKFILKLFIKNNKLLDKGEENGQ